MKRRGIEKNILFTLITLHYNFKSMVKSTIISAHKANNLFWLGRYEERVYITLHQLSKCCDKMIDGELEEYSIFWTRLDANGIYQSSEEFTFGMMYDEDNIASVMAAQVKAKDNAILYLEMSVALLKECRNKQEMNLCNLQPVIDWSLAFWGAAEQRLHNHEALYIMMMGRNVENLDMLLRFDYDHERIALAYDSLKRYLRHMPGLLNEDIESQLDDLIASRRTKSADTEYKNSLLSLLNQLTKI